MESIQNKDKSCEICGLIATNLCLDCLSYYCDSCYKFIHDKQINSQHVIEKIDYFVPIDTKCLIHPKYPLELFCVEEKGK